MYPHEYSVKQSKKILKNKNIKGCSRYDKTQLNRKILTISNEEYHKRKNEKYETIEDVVRVLTKDENITHYIMSYIGDFDYYKQLKNVYNGVMADLQIFNLSRYCIASRKFHRGQDDTYNKETMLHINI